jgi:hypothetical protein
MTLLPTTWSKIHEGQQKAIQEKIAADKAAKAAPKRAKQQTKKANSKV